MVASARSLLLGFLTGGASAAGLGYLKQQRLADSKDDVTSSSGSGSSKPSSALSSTSVPDSAAPSALKKRWLKALEASNWVGKSRMAMAEKDHQTGTPWDYDWDRFEKWCNFIENGGWGVGRKFWISIEPYSASCQSCQSFQAGT